MLPGLMVAGAMIFFLGALVGGGLMWLALELFVDDDEHER